MPSRGWWGMVCWNGLSSAQQTRLIEHGNLPIFSGGEGTCERPAACCIETETDEAPGPRFYCYPCAIGYLREKGTTPVERKVTKADLLAFLEELEALTEDLDTEDIVALGKNNPLPDEDFRRLAGKIMRRLRPDASDEEIADEVDKIMANRAES